MIEGGLMSYIVKGMSAKHACVYSSIVPRAGTTGRVVDDAEEKMGRMLRNFQDHVHNKFNRYAFGFFACELMNLALAASALVATHRFLDYQYFDYGVKIYR